MIVATHMGMYMPALRPDWEKCLRHGEPELQVRSRRRIDLLNLRAFMQTMGLEVGDVIQLPNTDYQFRVYCTRAAWGWALQMLAEEIDYTKFKDTPAKKHGDNALTNCYTKMWSAIFNAFPVGSVYAKSFKRGSRRGSPQNRVMAEPDRWKSSDWKGHGARQSGVVYDEVSHWAKRETVTESRYETVEWRKMADLSDRELALLMRETDEPTAADLADIEIEQADRDKISPLPADYRQPGPLECADGSLNHAWCDHAKTKSARRRCRKAWLDVRNS